MFPFAKTLPPNNEQSSSMSWLAMSGSLPGLSALTTCEPPNIGDVMYGLSECKLKSNPGTNLVPKLVIIFNNRGCGRCLGGLVNYIPNGHPYQIVILWKREEITLLDFHDVHTDIAGTDMKTSCCSYLISCKYV